MKRLFGVGGRSMATYTHDNLLSLASAVIPPLTSSLHKGSSGRVAIVGGSYEYCGAPYYAGMAALRTGADLAFVFCAERAAIPIKSYSPELMVIPCLDDSDILKKGLDRLDSIHSLVIGPGLGRDDNILKSAKELMLVGKLSNKNLVLDGDALFLLTNDDHLRKALKNSAHIVLTPNKVEFLRLYEKVFGNSSTRIKEIGDDKVFWSKQDVNEILNSNFEGHPCFKIIRLARELGMVILQKGKVDYISDGKCVLANSKFGSARRCGGQGDFLAGSTGVFLAWNSVLQSKQIDTTDVDEHLLCCFASSCLTRKANELSFKDKKRSMVTPDMIEELGAAFQILFSDLDEVSESNSNCYS